MSTPASALKLGQRPSLPRSKVKASGPLELPKFQSSFVKRPKQTKKPQTFGFLSSSAVGITNIYHQFVLNLFLFFLSWLL